MRTLWAVIFLGVVVVCCCCFFVCFSYSFILLEILRMREFSSQFLDNQPEIEGEYYLLDWILDSGLDWTLDSGLDSKVL